MTVPDDRVTWRKSAQSQQESDCVEVALTACKVGVRDTKDRPGGQLAVPTAAWSAFTDAVRTGHA
jgi:hypothetical protein